jgi:transcriptional regulator with XRE-family HTH domain
MKLVGRLVELRKEKNLSQEELAEKLYVSRQAIFCAVTD